MQLPRNLRPSRMIFIGSSMIVAAILLNVIVSLTAVSSLNSIKSSIKEMETSGMMQEDRADDFLESAHWRTMAMAGAQTLSVVCLLIGIAFVLLGSFLTARAIERMQPETLQVVEAIELAEDTQRLS